MNLQPIEPITQAGIKQAIGLNLKRDDKKLRMLPFAIYWICHHDTGRGKGLFGFKPRTKDYQISVKMSDHQITVLIMTPEEPPPGTDELPVPENMWLIRRRDKNKKMPGENVTEFPGQVASPAYGYKIDLVSICGAPD